MKNHLPLTIEMIPKSCWGQNLRKVVSSETWKELRDEIRDSSGDDYYDDPKCMICSAVMSFFLIDRARCDIPRFARTDPKTSSYRFRDTGTER